MEQWPAMLPVGCLEGTVVGALAEAGAEEVGVLAVGALGAGDHSVAAPGVALVNQGRTNTSLCCPKKSQLLREECFKCEDGLSDSNLFFFYFFLEACICYLYGNAIILLEVQVIELCYFLCCYLLRPINFCNLERIF